MAEGAPLYVYSGGFVCTGNSEFIGHSHKLRERARSHLAHDLATMNPDGNLARAEFED
jgi:hypothetical protein